MSTFDLTCLGCGATVDCPDIPDSQLYSLENPTFPFVLDCPDNNCQQGPIIYFSCCDRLLQAPVPVGSSSGQIQSILNSLAAQCFNLQSACGELPPFPPGGFTPNHPITLFFNQSQTCKLICPDGNSFTYTVPAGWVAAITQSKANATAYSLACARARSTRFCLSDLVVSTLCPFSATISASGPVVTPCTWQVISGSLPSGLTLGGFSPTIDTTLGAVETIQGTPTSAGTSTFTLQCTGSDGAFMQKVFTLTVSTCAIPNLLHWSFDPASNLTDDNLKQTLVGFGPFAATGLIGEGLKSNSGVFGVNDIFVDFPTPSPMAAYVTGNSISQAFWVNFADAGSGFPSFLARLGYTGIDGHAYELDFLVGGDIAGPGLSNPGGILAQDPSLSGPRPITFTVPVTLSTSTWYFIVLVYNGATGKLGISINNSAITYSGSSFTLPSGVPPSSTSWIYVNLSWGGSLINGPNATIDEYLIKTDYLLTATDITHLYNAGAGKPWGPTYWPP